MKNLVLLFVSVVAVVFSGCSSGNRNAEVLDSNGQKVQAYVENLGSTLGKDAVFKPVFYLKGDISLLSVEQDGERYCLLIQPDFEGEAVIVKIGNGDFAFERYDVDPEQSADKYKVRILEDGICLWKNGELVYVYVYEDTAPQSMQYPVNRMLNS